MAALTTFFGVDLLEVIHVVGPGVVVGIIVFTLIMDSHRQGGYV